MPNRFTRHEYPATQANAAYSRQRESVNDAETLKKAAPKAQLKLISGMSHILKVGPADKQQNAATYGMPDLPLHPDLIPILTDFINNLK